MMTDLMQAVSYLRERPDVDPKRIAAAGYSMGSFVVSLTCAVETRLKACVAVAGGYLDGPGGYWDTSNKKMCQAIPYLIHKGSADEVVAIPSHGEEFFADA